MRRRYGSGSPFSAAASAFTRSRSAVVAFTGMLTAGLLSAEAGASSDPGAEGTLSGAVSAEQGSSSEGDIRFGRHAAFDRIVFERSAPVDVDVFKDGAELLVTFDRHIAMPLPVEEAFRYRVDNLPQTVFAMRTEDQGRRYRIEIDPDSRFELKHWDDGRLVVLDIIRAWSEDGLGVIADDEVSVQTAVPDTAPEMDDRTLDAEVESR